MKGNVGTNCIDNEIEIKDVDYDFLQHKRFRATIEHKLEAKDRDDMKAIIKAAEASMTRIPTTAQVQKVGTFVYKNETVDLDQEFKRPDYPEFPDDKPEFPDKPDFPEDLAQVSEASADDFLQ